MILFLKIEGLNFLHCLRPHNSQDQSCVYYNDKFCYTSMQYLKLIYLYLSKKKVDMSIYLAKKKKKIYLRTIYIILNTL
jgi:hypothetical protein